MRGTILHPPSDVRYEERPDPTILGPTDAIVRTVAVCVCGSDLWPTVASIRSSSPAPTPGSRVRRHRDRGRARRRWYRPHQGAHRRARWRAVLECVGTGESMLQALRSTRPGGMVRTLDAPHGVEVPIEDLFWPNLGLRGGPRRCGATCPICSTGSGAGRSSRQGVRRGAAAGTGRRRLPGYG